MPEDHELEVLLGLDGFEFQFVEGYRVRIAAQLVGATTARPHGVKYSLTLHDPAGRRIYGLDNAHRFARRRVEFDHRHVYGRRRIVTYFYRGPVELLEDFYREVSGFCGKEVSYEPPTRDIRGVQGTHAGGRTR